MIALGSDTERLTPFSWWTTIHTAIVDCVVDVGSHDHHVYALTARESRDDDP